MHILGHSHGESVSSMIGGQLIGVFIIRDVNRFTELIHSDSKLKRPALTAMCL